MTVEVQDVDRILLVPKSHKIGQKRGGNGAYRVERWRKKVQSVLKWGKLFSFILLAPICGVIFVRLLLKFTNELRLFSLLALLMLSGSSLWAQDKAKETKKEIPEPEAIQLVTKKTGLQLHATYFGSNLEKEAAPIILLHPWEEQGALYYKFAKELQTMGYAVLVPDLRGHGKSIQAAVARDGKIDLAKMGKVDYGFIVAEDMEAMKGFLLREHNEGNLNIELLSVIGVGEGSMFGTLWAVNDWSFPSLPGMKQGQDVKALILISPVMTMKGVNAETALKNPIFRQLSFFLVAGSTSSSSKNLGRMLKTLEKTHTYNDKDLDASNLWLAEPNTSLEMAQFVNKQPKLSNAVDSFLSKRVKAYAKQLPWAERKQKLQ
jgi:pimeloyl-ACP methyl ester carboxylesterase